MSTSLVRRDETQMSFADIRQVSQAFAKSGFFADANDEAKAIVKVMAGAELGFGPFASMSGLYIVKGKVSISANLMAARIKSSAKYDFKVAKGHPTDSECSITFLEKVDGQWIELGVSTFTAKDAQKAGTQNMDKFGKNMLFARAISNGCKFYCPDVFSSPVYTPEEMGTRVDGEGNPLETEYPVIDVGNDDRAERDGLIEALHQLFIANGKTENDWAGYFLNNRFPDIPTEGLRTKLEAWQKAALAKQAEAPPATQEEIEDALASDDNPRAALLSEIDVLCTKLITAEVPARRRAELQGKVEVADMTTEQLTAYKVRLASELNERNDKAK